MQPRVGFGRQLSDPLQVTVACRIMLASVCELVTAVVGERLEKLIAGFAIPVGHRHERLVDKVSEYVDHVDGWDVVAGADEFSGADTETAGEHGQAPEDALLVAEQQVVAPVDQAPQRFPTWLCRPLASGQQTEPVVDSGG